MRIKNTLLAFLGSAMIALPAKNASAQSIPENFQLKEYKTPPAKVLGPKDNFSIDYGAKAKVRIIFPFDIGDGTARWESKSCNYIPGEKEEIDSLKVLDGTINLDVQFYGRLHLYFKTYMNNQGTPIKDFVADYNYKDRKKQKFTSLDSTLMKETFPDTWKEIQEFHHTNFRGKSDVTNFETSYFNIVRMIKNAESKGKAMPIDTTFYVFEDTTSYNVKTIIEKNDKGYTAKLYVKGKDGKPIPDIHALKSVTINMGENYVPQLIKVRFKKWGIIPAEADIKMKNYEIR